MVAERIKVAAASTCAGRDWERKPQPAEQQDAEVRRRHRPTGAVMPMFPFKPLAWKGSLIFAGNDPPHCLKAVAANARRGQRVIHWCRNVLWVCLAPLRAEGLTVAAYVGKDGQSDSQGAQVLCSSRADRLHWDGLGVTLWQFTTTLIIGSFTASDLFQPEELFPNLMTGGTFSARPVM